MRFWKTYLVDEFHVGTTFVHGGDVIDSLLFAGRLVRAEALERLPRLFGLLGTTTNSRLWHRLLGGRLRL